MVKVQQLKVKFKQYKKIWFLVIKLSIVFGASFFIYKRLSREHTFHSGAFLVLIKRHLLTDWRIVFSLLSLTCINWLLEILKWKKLVSTIDKLSFYNALTQSLSSHTLSILTPFKAGEYGGKALYYTKNLRKRIVSLTFVGNLAQLIITIFIGLVSFVFVIRIFDIAISPHKIRRIGSFIALLLLALFSSNRLFKNKKEGFYQRTATFFGNLPKSVARTTVLLSLLRYLVFSHQFYFLLTIFNIDIPYLTAMMLIFSMYFIATMIPVFSLFDFVIKGSIALYLFSFLQVNELTIVLISTLMWLLNFALPAFIGSYFVLLYKPISK